MFLNIKTHKVREESRVLVSTLNMRSCETKCLSDKLNGEANGCMVLHKVRESKTTTNMASHMGHITFEESPFPTLPRWSSFLSQASSPCRAHGITLVL